MSLASNIIRIINNDDGYTINEAKTEIKTAIDGTKKEFGIKGINAFKKVKKECDAQGFTAYIIPNERILDEFSAVFCGKDSFSGLYACASYTSMNMYNKYMKDYRTHGHNPFDSGWGMSSSEYKPINTPEKTFNYITQRHDKSQIFYVTGEKLFEKLT
jgi:hypothetical protein